MNSYLLLKWLHILSATILFGTGIGTAFFKLSADLSRDIRAIRIVNERTVWADWLFTTPAAIIQPLSGFALAYIAGYSLMSPWLIYSFILYIIALACWLPVIWLQIRMRDISYIADKTSTPLPPPYWRYAKIWFWLGFPALIAFLSIYYLMTFKPII